MTATPFKYDLSAMRRRARRDQSCPLRDELAPPTPAEMVAWSLFDSLRTAGAQVQFFTWRETAVGLLPDSARGYGGATFVKDDELDFPRISIIHPGPLGYLDFQIDAVVLVTHRKYPVRYEYADPNCFEKLAAVLAVYDVNLDVEAL